MKRILILVGDATTSRSVDRIVKQTFREPHVVACGLAVDAEAVLATESFDLLIVDQHLPTRSGRKFLDDNKERLDGVPVIMLSAFPADTAGAEDVDHLMRKPIDSEELQTVCAKLLGLGL